MSKRTILMIALGLLLPPITAAVQTLNGQTDGGAYYTIQAPDDWRPSDGLVIYNHGFDIDPIGPNPDLGVLAEFLLERRYAVAASSYRLNGWALFNSAEDNQQLYRQFTDQLGTPDKVVVFGGSLGSLVTVQSIERGGIGNVVAAYPVCGPLLGSDVWHQALDLRLAYDVVCEGVSGASLPGGASGLPYTLDPDQFDGILGDLTAAAVGAAVSACTGLPFPAALRSDGQQQRLDRLLRLAGISEEFLGLNMLYSTAVLSDLVRAPDKLDGRSALSNLHVIYDDPDIDARIQRVERDPFDHLYLKRAYTPTGRVGNTKVLITHTDKDDLVFVEHVEAYRQRIDPAQLATAIVVEDQPGHCAYTEAELVAGWDTLMAWVDGADKPDAGAIQQRCREIENEGQYGGPCRYDPGFDPQARTSRFTARNEAEEAVTPAMSGAFYVASKSGQGWFVEVLEDGRAVVYWFTFDGSGNPVWIGGTGEVLDNAVLIDDSLTTSGASFGDAFDPADVSLHPWGKMQFIFTAAGQGLMEYQGPEGFGSNRETIEQLIQIDTCTNGTQAVSGLWYDPARNGEGIILQQQADERLFAAWFTYDTSGRQLWFFGEASSASEDGFVIDLSRFSGPAFGPGYDPQTLAGQSWGQLTLTTASDDTLDAQYQSSDPDYGGGQLALQRLTQPASSCAR